jgi:uncharacterized protein (UPF0332 family)
MPDPADLLALARRLSDASGPAPPNDAELRRAVSTAYYALFHKVARRAAQRFMGTGHEDTAGFALLHRCFNHGRMKEVCEALQVSTLNKKYKRYLRRSAVSQDMRDFAAFVPLLQEYRHEADYDPAAQFLPSFVSELVDGAESAMDAFDRVTPDEQADVLALMMVGTRG